MTLKASFGVNPEFLIKASTYNTLYAVDSDELVTYIMHKWAAIVSELLNGYNGYGVNLVNLTLEVLALAGLVTILEFFD